VRIKHSELAALFQSQNEKKSRVQTSLNKSLKLLNPPNFYLILAAAQPGIKFYFFFILKKKKKHSGNLGIISMFE
jgi:hypothetical protein